VSETATVGGAQSLSGPAGGAKRSGWSLGLLLGAVVGLVARFVVGDANKRGRATIGPLHRLLAVVASSSLVLPSVGLVARVVVAFPTVVPIWLIGAGMETASLWKGWRVPHLLEGPVAHLVVSHGFYVALHVFLAHPLSLNSNGAVDQAVERWVLTSRHNLMNAIVQTVEELELFLLLGIGVIGGMPHNLGEATFVFLYPHHTLSHGTKFLGLLDDHLLGHMLFVKGPGELLPCDVSRVLVGITIAIPP
jgi:hypothetical protein